ncbi:MAG TPA: hypothetical protein VN700_06280 [Vicinamibacterales bacterium]|nr:hypothetical protein [Vicinamibacterales bacterium]
MLTWWVVILTLLVAVQTVAITVVALRSLQLFKRAETTLDGVDRAVGPVTDGAKELLSDLQAVRATARRAQQAVILKAWPVFGVIAAGRAIAKQLSSRKRRSPDTRQDEDASARFTAEGGPIHDSR